MEKTLILGNNPDKGWIKNLGLSTIEVPNISVGRNADIVDFIKTLPTDLNCVVIDSDSLNSDNPELPLDIALYIRLMLPDCLKTSLADIVIVSDFTMGSFMGYGVKSMILMTKGVLFTDSENIGYAVENAVALTPSEYVDGFLRLIKVEPQEKVEGRHSIANEWGAEALYNVISGGIRPSLIPIKAESSLYFKYSNVVSLDAEDVSALIDGHTPRFLTTNISINDKINYLIIDDETDKGWDKVLMSLLPNANQEVWNQPTKTYQELSESIRSKISNGYYDIIFLDLRMSGIVEDNIVNPEQFSGMKILRSIKEVNSGIQVIMLTATNKAWNVKALLDAGANGYYMKESPEYHFPLKYTEQNALAFVKTIKECINNAYLQDIVSESSSLQKKLPTDSELTFDIKNQMSIALSLILKAKTQDEYAFAYISLEQIFEITATTLIRQESTRGSGRCFFTEDSHEQCRLYEKGKDVGFIVSSSGNKVPPVWMRVSSIYYQLYGGSDLTFDRKVKELINLRNKYIHPNDGGKPVITSENFIELFETMVEYLSVFK
ncbi:MAG: response regulator [Muribaculaceae bacterium]|nr:response regulator [Muribaculaceae bacterium]